MEEAFELISTGAWSIVPPLLALALALITKEVYSSLTIGVFVGMVIYQFTLNGVGVDQLVTAFTDVPNAMALQIADNGALLLFLALLGALTVVIATAGGSRAYAEWVSTHIKNARAAQVLTGLLGIIIFDGMRWLINALPGLRDWLAVWRLERRNRKAIRRLWRAYGRKPPHGL